MSAEHHQQGLIRGAMNSGAEGAEPLGSARAVMVAAGRVAMLAARSAADGMDPGALQGLVAAELLKSFVPVLTAFASAVGREMIAADLIDHPDVMEALQRDVRRAMGRNAGRGRAGAQTSRIREFVTKHPYSREIWKKQHSLSDAAAVSGVRVEGRGAGRIFYLPDCGACQADTLAKYLKADFDRRKASAR